jgi:hypothetical protein
VVAGEARGGEPARGGETALMCGFHVDLDFEVSSILSWVTWCWYWQILIISRAFEGIKCCVHAAF